MIVKSNPRKIVSSLLNHSIEQISHSYIVNQMFQLLGLETFSLLFCFVNSSTIILSKCLGFMNHDVETLFLLVISHHHSFLCISWVLVERLLSSTTNCNDRSSFYIAFMTEMKFTSLRNLQQNTTFLSTFSLKLNVAVPECLWNNTTNNC